MDVDADMAPEDGFGFQWHITDRCAARCAHCYQSGTAAADPPTETLARIADHVMGAVPGPVTVNVTGGEPLLHEGLFDLMTRLAGFDNLGELNLITSTAGMEARTIRALKSLPRLDYVKVSLESHDPRVNDAIRGDGHHATTLRNLRALAESGLRTIVMITLSGRNHGSVAGLCTLAGELGARGVIFERFVPLGRGAAEMANQAVTPNQWKEVLAAIAAVAGIEASDLLPYKAFWVDGTAVSGAPCCLGSSSMAIMPDGTVFPCRRVPIPVGKLPCDDMAQILRTLVGYSFTPQMCFGF